MELLRGVTVVGRDLSCRSRSQMEGLGYAWILGNLMR